MASPPPCRCRNCGGPARVPSRPPVFVPDRPPWVTQLAKADFSKACVADRVCNTCGGAAFCDHCCREHHRGHDTSPAAASASDDHHAAAAHRRDSFCIFCRAAFCSELCAHHDAASGGGEGHEVVPVVEYDRWYCARCTGWERWFLTIIHGVQTFRDEHGNVLVPLHRKRAPLPECPSWFPQLVSVDFSETCATDRVCNTCGAAGFCEHCCGEHHRGHDTAAATVELSAVHSRRDSFCTACRVAFCSELCAHHAAGGHEVIPIDAYGDRHFVRSTGSEPWFTPSAFGGIETFEDKDGNLMVPLEQKRSSFPETGLRIAANHPSEMDGV